MTLQVVQPQTGKTIEEFPCTPDGNCFAIIQDLDVFALRIAGPAFALFEPKEILIGDSITCQEDKELTFRLKGHRIVIPIVIMTTDELVQGPSGVQIKL